MRKLILVAALMGCSPSLGPADHAELADVAATILKCQNLGRACKADGGTDCYGVYEKCMKDAGLK